MKINVRTLLQILILIFVLFLCIGYIENLSYEKKIGVSPILEFKTDDVREIHASISLGSEPGKYIISDKKGISRVVEEVMGCRLIKKKQKISAEQMKEIVLTFYLLNGDVIELKACYLKFNKEEMEKNKFILLKTVNGKANYSLNHCLFQGTLGKYFLKYNSFY